MDNKIPQVDHLILLVGSNPLPNLVVADVLVKEGGSVYLLCTNETSTLAGNLKTMIAQKKNLMNNQVQVMNINTIEGTQIKAPTSTSIADRIKEISSPITEGFIGLNYTGGTKFMGIHSYLALKAYANELDKACKNEIQVQLSYLDAANMSLIIDEQKSSITLRNKTNIFFDDIIKLHGWSYQKKPSDNPKHLDCANYILEIMLKNESEWKTWRGWLRKVRNETGQPPSKKKQSFKVEQDEQVVCNIFGQITGNIQATCNSLCFDIPKIGEPEKAFKWLEGGWFEDIVFDTLQKTEFYINDTSFKFDELLLDIEMKSESGVETQIDVIARIDFQFFLFSITTDDTKGLCKSKLMEANIRARQIAGDEACAALICLADKRTSGAIQNELSSLFEGKKDKIHVFGRDDWKNDENDEGNKPRIVSEIRDWVSTNINK